MSDYRAVGLSNRSRINMHPFMTYSEHIFSVMMKQKAESTSGNHSWAPNLSEVQSTTCKYRTLVKFTQQKKKTRYRIQQLLSSSKILDTGAWVLLYEIHMYKRVQLLGSCYMNMYDTYWYYKRVLLYISIGIIHLHITRPKQLWSSTVCYTLAYDRTFILFTRCILNTKLVLVTFK